ncbi:hypothetical protein [Burkholderia vietnamiensis]|uniref:hypothetical protein n=1 Tax=Burkholderia vietnamiensis TaxID=60552 RepID=UPI001D159764|nr:hypothetical protein [Burkholderia vietnamiensis]UEC01222.1 hypothetical protein LK462_21920 [Burkholderia vietnamiensis]
MKKPIPRPQPAPLSYGVTSVGTEGIWHAIKNFLTFSERGNVNPTSTKEAPRTAVTAHRRISDRQVEIMTATLCEVIANKNLPPDEGKEMVGQLIRAMVIQVSRLNAAITCGVDEVIPRASSKAPD